MIPITEDTEFPVYGLEKLDCGVKTLFCLTGEKDDRGNNISSICIFDYVHRLEIHTPYSCAKNTYDSAESKEITEAQFLKEIEIVQKNHNINFIIK